MPQILTASEIYDPEQGAAAYERGRQQAANALAGKALAAGNTTGAKNALFNVGNLDAGLQLQQMQEQREAAMRARQQAEQQRAYRALGAVVRNIKTPEQFERAKASATRTLGIDASQYTFDDLPTLQAQFSEADRQLAIKERAQEAARRYLKAGKAFYDTDTGKWITPPAGAEPDEYGLNPVYGTDAAGNPILLQVGKSGRAVQTQVPEGIRVSGGVTSVPTGTGTLLVNKRTGQPISTVAKDVRGAEVQKQQGKIDADKPAAYSRAQDALEKLRNATTMATELSEHPGLEAASGPISTWLPTVSEDTANFETELDTLKTKVFVAAINNMRELSKTGGALGSVTEREIEKMENSLRNLQLRQGNENMRANLLKVAEDFNGSIARVKMAYEHQYGAPQQYSQQPVASPAMQAPAAQMPAAVSQRAASVPAQAAPSRPAGLTDAQIIAEARKAVDAGKPAGPVRERLKAWGINF